MGMNFAPINGFVASSLPDAWRAIHITVPVIAEGRVMTPVVGNDARVARMAPESRLTRAKGMRMVQAAPENRIVVGDRANE